MRNTVFKYNAVGFYHISINSRRFETITNNLLAVADSVRTNEVVAEAFVKKA